MLKPCELALPHGGGMGVGNLAATAGSNRWVPRIGFDTSFDYGTSTAMMGSGRGDVN